MIPLIALQVEVSPSMKGSKFAVRFGNGPVYVSPAMFELMKGSTPEELRFLLNNIMVKQFPAMPDFTRLEMAPRVS